MWLEAGLAQDFQCLVEAWKYVQWLPGPPPLQPTDRNIIPYNLGEVALLVSSSYDDPLLK